MATPDERPEPTSFLRFGNFDAWFLDIPIAADDEKASAAGEPRLLHRRPRADRSWAASQPSASAEMMDAEWRMQDDLASVGVLSCDSFNADDGRN